MGIMACQQSESNHSNNESQSESNHYQLELKSLLSQPSLQSVPSLTSQSQQHCFSNTNHYCLTTLKGQTSYISSLTLAGKFLYAGSSDREIRSWKRKPFDSDQLDQESSTNNFVVAGKGAVKSLVVQADKLYSAHQDHKIRDESLLYSVSWDRTLKIWRTTDFKCLESVTNAHDDAINALALADDGHVYTGSADKKIKVWKKNPGEKHRLVATLIKHNSGVNTLALSNDGSLLYSGACDRSIVVWEKSSSDGGGGNMDVMGALRGHTSSILCLAVVSDLVCSGSADRSVRIWRGVDRNYGCVAVLEGHTGPVKCLTAAIDNCNTSDTAAYLVYSGGLDCDIKVWQVLVPVL